MLRAADRATGRLEVHTDAASAKVAQIAADPRATLLVWEAALACRSACAPWSPCTPAAAGAACAVPAAARALYGGPRPGTPLASLAPHRPGPMPPGSPS